jgi:putative FmdB family regulatory protein
MASAGGIPTRQHSRHLQIMPVYEFRCTEGCENYEVWRSIQERSRATDCPLCGSEGERVFSPPMTLSGTLRLKVENKEPRLVRKSSESKEGKPRLRESTSRPWMLNRGC